MLLKDSFDQLQIALTRLSNIASGAQRAIITSLPGEFKTGEAAISEACGAISNLWNLDGQVDARQTQICIGAIGVDEHIMAAVKHVNLCKDRFKAAYQIFQDRISVKGGGKPSAAWKAKQTRSALSDVGLGRLSLRLSNRHIPILDYQPESIGFSYSSGGKSIKKMSVKQVIAALDKTGYDSEKCRNDKETIQALPEDMILAWVQRQAGYYKANVFKDGGLARTISVFLPIFYLVENDEPVSLPKELPPSWRIRTRAPRSDRKLGQAALIDTLPIYSYG